MTRYGRKRRRLADITPREMDEMRASHDEAELDRYLAEEEEREPREDGFERAQARWLEPVNPDDFKSAA